MTTSVPEPMKLIERAHNMLINLQPHIAQLPKQYRPFIDSHVDVAMESLRIALAALRTSSQEPEAVELAGERGNKAGPAPSGPLHAEQPAPSSGSLPNTSGPVSPATTPAPEIPNNAPLLSDRKPREIGDSWNDSESCGGHSGAGNQSREAHPTPSVLGTPQEGEIVALSNALECYATHEAVPGIATAMRRAATLLRDLATARQERDAAEARAGRAEWDHEAVRVACDKLQLRLIAAERERDEAMEECYKMSKLSAQAEGKP